MLKGNIFEAVRALYGAELVVPEFAVDYAKDEKFGDYATNVAMVLRKALKKNPVEIAEQVALKLREKSAENFTKIEVVAPGYINFFLAPKYLQNKVAEIVAVQEKFGDSELGKNIQVNNEFISANPTGPLHLGNGRGGFYGDSLSRVLRKSGYAVTNEYYVNDAGEQVVKLGHSVLQDAEAVYAGEYINELQKKYAELKDVRAVGSAAAADILEQTIKKTVTGKMQVSFDKWVSEKKLYEDGLVEEAIATLEKKGLTFKEEGALWLRTTQFGDDKDRVLIKKDGQKTYFASDCGYILDKMRRGAEIIIESWGADHHGYVGRFKAAAKALGFVGKLRFVIVQLVRLVKDGQEVRMSKRAGNVVYIDDLIAEIGHDVTRFFFLMYSPDTHMNFDLGLAKEQSQKNPVFYVQYAHARICSILRKAEEIGLAAGEVDLQKLATEKELSLIRELDRFAELVAEIAESYEVHKLPHYAIRLADKFHSFYNEVKVIDETDRVTTRARLNLVNAVKIVLAETLRLIGVSAPDKM